MDDMHPADSSRRTFRGRPLPHPDDDLVDQGLAFDVETLVDRRRLLSLFGLTAAGVGLAACGAGSPTSTTTATPATSTSGGAEGLVEIPDETAGPYPGDGSNGPDVLEQSGVVRSDIRSSFDIGDATADGVPMTLTLTVLDLAGGGVPFEGVAVYVWQCDRDGGYSMYSSGLENENYLRGVQIADADGSVTFTSIVPACYPGRWPHVHFEVYPDASSITDAQQAIATSQVALPKSLCDAVYATNGYESSVSTLAQLTLATDNVFGDDGGAHQIATVSGSVEDGFDVRLAVPVDTTTEPSGGGAPGGPAGGEPPGR